VYQDGHEREDVKAYRQDVFLPGMKSLQPHMMEWDEAFQVVDKSYGANQRPLVFIAHDECPFNSNDGRKKIWIHENKSPIRKKG